MELSENIAKLMHKLEIACNECGRDKNTVKIVPATKTVPPKIISALTQFGICEIGENRVQELTEKYPQLSGMKWHFIGALQTNKVKYIIDKVDLIHSLDRFVLADEIEKQASKKGITANVLIEINAGGESEKSGVAVENLKKLYDYVLIKKHIRIKGFMAVFPIGAKESLYENMHRIFLEYKAQNSDIDTLSMGMSDDFEIAIKNGATMIRPGSILFGKRSVSLQ